MCHWMYYTGSECAHRPPNLADRNWDGTPRPFDEKKFMSHGVWRVAHCRQYWDRGGHVQGNSHCPIREHKPDYYKMTRDMQNPWYEIVDDFGTGDFRCPRCRCIDPKTGKKELYPRQPEWHMNE
jgi:hypothetical protein